MLQLQLTSKNITVDTVEEAVVHFKKDGICFETQFLFFIVSIDNTRSEPWTTTLFCLSAQSSYQNLLIRVSAGKSRVDEYTRVIFSWFFLSRVNWESHA